MENRDLFSLGVYISGHVIDGLLLGCLESIYFREVACNCFSHVSGTQLRT